MIKTRVWIQVLLSSLLFGLTGSGCQSDKPDTLFKQLDARHTGIDFSNNLSYNADFNVYTYRNFYNGGGVALGDVNQDGMLDVYLTANMLPNRLYLNKGGFRFEDITEQAGVGGTRAWATGVTMADVNGDGLLDIYVCNSGDIQGDNKQNELFINQGDGTFSEEAERYGLADRGYSTHAAFFDYDRDGDLDCYLLNNSYQAIGSFNLQKNIRGVRDTLGGDKLFRNEGERFVDVSTEAGIFGSVIGFGLGVTVGDINTDGWPDIYVSNDFFERDYLYINQGDGTFYEDLERQMPHISNASMGADMADFNNDTRPDLFVTEMLPESYARLKRTTTFESWDRYQYGIENGYHHQFTRNMLQLNTGSDRFVDIGLYSGVAATDWSWGALMADFDQDADKDLFVANGIYQDLTDQDFINFLSNDETVRMLTGEGEVDFKQLIDIIPSTPIPNYAFSNEGDFQFADKSKDWGLATPSHSNGSAYGDLDNDGDLDLIVNTVNSELLIYENQAQQQPNGKPYYLRVELHGNGANVLGIGAKVKVKAAGQWQLLEQITSRGFQSSIDPRPLFGLGAASMADSLVVVWPDQTIEVRTDVPADQTVVFHQTDASLDNRRQAENGQATWLRQKKDVLSFSHEENLFVDFDRDQMVFHMRSTEGPRVAIADVDGNGTEDLFVGGARDQEAILWLQTPSGQFVQQPGPWADHRASEDLGVLFFDANGDEQLDLYVCSGGNEFAPGRNVLRDRLYINEGNGKFTTSQQNLPASRPSSTSCAVAADVDGDGDQDLFVGGRLRLWNYGVPAPAYLLINDGAGNFSPQQAADWDLFGMVTDAAWIDYDHDSDPDLVVVGEWMPVRIFENRKGVLVEQTYRLDLQKTHGWWNTLAVDDLDGDGWADLVVGNHGLNSRFEASSEAPCIMYVNDFDQNGTVEQVYCRTEEGQSVPMHLKDDLTRQMPKLKKTLLKYDDYADKTIQDIFSPDQLDRAIKDTVYTFASTIFWNQEGSGFLQQQLPAPAQFFPIYAAATGDLNADGRTDLILGGNLFGAKPDVGRYDAGYGLVLRQGEGRSWEVVPAARSGLKVEGEIRDLQWVKREDRQQLFIFRNRAELIVYE
jgi:hypothetical protein